MAFSVFKEGDEEKTILLRLIGRSDGTVELCEVDAGGAEM